jgi:hypothetical protein
MTLEAFDGEGAVQRARRSQPPWSLRAEEGHTGRPLRHLEATKFLVASASRLPLDPDDTTQASPGPARGIAFDICRGTEGLRRGLRSSRIMGSVVPVKLV